jgi:hypothetical protein
MWLKGGKEDVGRLTVGVVPNISDLPTIERDEVTAWLLLAETTQGPHANKIEADRPSSTRFYNSQALP